MFTLPADTIDHPKRFLDVTNDEKTHLRALMSRMNQFGDSCFLGKMDLDEANDLDL